MSISTATFTQWFEALKIVFAHNKITIETIDKDKLREKYYDQNFTPHETYADIINELRENKPVPEAA